MKTMILQAFNELKEEARLGEVKIIDDRILRILFNIDGEEIKEVPNLHIKDQNNFYNILSEYVYKALIFYELEPTKDNIKTILSFLFVNITSNEMYDLEKYIKKYINFMDDKILSNYVDKKNTNLGELVYSVEKQSYQQETPFCFKSSFVKDNEEYAMPRISFGISNGVCYIYAIQNKDRKECNNSEFIMDIKNKFRTINSGISKYRNVTPSFVVALSLFISFLKENGIYKIKVETPLPIRQKNRDMSLQQKIKFYSMKANIKKEELETFKRELENKKINDDFNSTIKFVNCFNRLKLHFDNIFLKELDEGVTLEILNLITTNDFLSEVVKKKER